MEKTDSTFKCPRARLAMGIGALGLLGMALAPAIAGGAQSQAATAGAFAAIVAALFGCAALLAWRLTARLKAQSFEEGMRSLAESAPLLFNQFSVSGAPVYCNSEGLKAFGLRDRQEFRDKLFSHLIPEFQPDGKRTADVVGEYTRKTMQDGSSQVELWHQTLGGDKLPLRCSLVKARLRGEDYLLIFSSDIRKELEAEAKKEAAVKERMQAVMDSAPMLCALFDEDGRILEVNREVEKMFAIPDRQTYIDHYSDFLPKYQPDGTLSADIVEKAAEEAAKKGLSRRELTYKLRDGTPVPAEDVARPIKLDGRTFFIVYTRDLRKAHARRAAEQAAQKRLHDMTGRLNGQLDTQASAITESSTAVEEMIANIRSVSGTLSKNAANVQNLQEASEVGHSGLSEVAADIREIARESESLLEINSVMQNIASQTNLLSMNAAIEAAHAGESGRGFAVVADEIRKLAESSSRQSKTISSVLKKIKGSIDKITRSTDNVMAKFGAIEGGVRIVAEQENGILNAMTEQGAGSAQIMQAIAQLNDITGQVKDDARQMVEAAAKLGV